MRYLLDTNVISESRRQQCNPMVRSRLAATADEDLFISVISLGEITYGISRLHSGKRRQELKSWIAQAEEYFADRLLNIDRDIARLWGELTAKSAKRGRPLNTSDGLIAATALRHGLYLMTRNVSDFAATGILLINPWDGEQS